MGLVGYRCSTSNIERYRALVFDRQQRNNVGQEALTMIPKYLYHYTSTETLFAILETSSIRFSRLDLVNDPYEGLCKLSGQKTKEFATSLFCSCWTESAEESIALWKIYTECSGVRIMADSGLFGSLDKLHSFPFGYVPVTPISPISVQMNIDGMPCQIKSIYGPFKVSYIFEEESLFSSGVRRVIANKGQPTQHFRHEISLFEIGSRKEAHWNYEKEWRFLCSPFGMISAPDKQLGVDQSPIITNDFVDISFSGEIVEVLAGPEMDTESFERLEKELLRRGIPLKKSVVKTRFPKKTTPD